LNSIFKNANESPCKVTGYAGFGVEIKLLNMPGWAKQGKVQYLL